LYVKKRNAFLYDENLGNFHKKEKKAYVVLTLGVGQYGHISFLGFPRTFIIDMALSAPRFIISVSAPLVAGG
jgi:hypothetical protein